MFPDYSVKIQTQTPLDYTNKQFT